MKNVSDLELAVQCVKEQRQEDFGTPPPPPIKTLF